MATNTTSVPPVGLGHVLKLLSSTTPIKQELTNTTAKAASEPPEALSEAPQFMNSLAELRNLSTALSTFYRRYDELQNHLDFIKTAIVSKLPDNLNELALIPVPETSPKPSLPEPVNQEIEPDNPSNSEPKPDSQIPNLESKPEGINDSVDEAKCQKPARSELENTCESMGGRFLRRYIVAHLSDSTKLREEVPKALKLSENPSKLVLECVGRFYLQGSKAYTKEKPVIDVRRASVLVLECFLLMDSEGLVIESKVEEEAAEAAVAWRSRIVSEGGLHQASEIDARGLLMLISGFGIPDVFTNEDIRDLIMTTRVRRISSALRRSSYLVPRIPAIIDLMVKNDSEVEAADMALSFGLEDKCSPKKILTSFLRHMAKTKIQGSVDEMKTAKKKQLSDLKSIIRCLEAHKIDPSYLLPELKINEKITSLEKEIAELDKKVKETATAKRKAAETDFSRKKNEDVKRSRFTGHTLVHHISPAGHGDSLSSYNGLRANNSFPDERLRGTNINNYSASPSVLYRSRLPEDIAGSIAGGPSLSSGVVNTDPYGRVYVQRPAAAVDSVSQMVYRGDGQLYEWRGPGAGSSRSGEHPALSERVVTQAYGGQTYASQPSSSGFYRSAQPSLEGFVGVPHASTSGGVWARVPGSGSDIYQFADSVLERESYRPSSSGAGGANLPSGLPAHRSSYLY